MSLASLITLRKAATISGILLCIAVLEYIIIVHLYIDLQKKQQVGAGNLRGVTEAEVPFLEDWRTKLQKAANQDSGTAKSILENPPDLGKMIAKLKKRKLNISNTKPFKTDSIPPNAGNKASNAVERDRNALREPLRHPLESDANDANYGEREDRITPSALEDSGKADPRQPRNLSRSPRNTAGVITKHENTGDMKARLPRVRPVAKSLGERRRTDSNLNRKSKNSTSERSELQRKESTTREPVTSVGGRTKPLDRPPDDGPGNSETVMRVNPIRMLHLKLREQTGTAGQGTWSKEDGIPTGKWGPPAVPTEVGGGVEQIQNGTEEMPTKAYLEYLLADYVMEMESIAKAVHDAGKAVHDAGKAVHDADKGVHNTGGKSQKPGYRTWRFPIDESEFELVQTEHGVTVVKKSLGPEVLVENDTRPFRKLTKFEEEGKNIMFTLRTTMSYHEGRLPLMFDTWMSETDCSRIFLVTDGYDWVTQAKARLKEMHYEVTSCGRSYHQLCCKAGVEMELMFKPGNEKYDWLCHVDDDMYLIPKNLVKILSKFNPRKEPIYFGRSGSDWYTPRRVKFNATLSKPGKKYHFAVGGMYCLSRAMLEEAKEYLVGGEAFAASCRKTEEPEDVTVGLVVGAVLNHVLSRTEQIYTHGLHLSSTVDPYTLGEQIAFSYGFGSFHWGEDPYNAIYVPDFLFSLEEDESQFKSLHCYLYPTVPWCVTKKEQILQRGGIFFHHEDD